MLNNERFICQALKNIAERKGYSFRTYSYGWIVEILHGTKTFRLTGYEFDINPSSGVKIAKDKYATHCLLEGIVPRDFLIPSAFVPCNWKAEFIGTTRSDIVESFLSEHGYPLVLKDARGSQGKDVFKIGNRGELMKTLDYFEDKGCDAVLEPFVKSGKELRILFLDGEVQLAYYKLPGKGWKFNLSLWALTEIIPDSERENIAEAVEVARTVMGRVGLRFASCDFLILRDGSFKFLEVNGGVCVDRFVEQNPEYAEWLEGMYEAALERSFVNRGTE